ncbi:SLBB domain-containing protein [Phycisphaerales bacterium AB-hyl4]|uniref:SLBB domain-containing protein n=1 Tax=Natronomicrosphaera hydrolytica TaxID=3242702 RepID=A0ABV4U5G7_9BACT
MRMYMAVAGHGGWRMADRTSPFVIEFRADGRVVAEDRPGEVSTTGRYVQDDEQLQIYLNDDEDAWLVARWEGDQLVLTHPDAQADDERMLLERVRADDDEWRKQQPQTNTITRRQQSITQARGIHQAMVMVGIEMVGQHDRDSPLPDDVAVLYERQIVTADYLLSPTGQVELPADFDQWPQQRQHDWLRRNASYILVPSLVQDFDKDTIAVFQRPEHSDDTGISVAFNDNAAHWETDVEAVDRRLAEQTGMTMQELIDRQVGLASEPEAGDGEGDKPVAEAGDADAQRVDLLRNVVALRQRQLDRVHQLLDAGRASPDDVEQARQALIEAQLQLAAADADGQLEAAAGAEPARQVVYITGPVGRPGAYVLPEDGMTLLQLIASADNIQWTGVPAVIEIVRQQPDGSERRLPHIRVKDLVEGEAENPWLQAGDVVVDP